MELRPVKTRRIYEDVVEQIKRLIAEGKLKVGDRLPSERDLADRLQVSRASVREALSALEMMGLLETRSGEGTYVKGMDIDSIVAPLAWVLFMEKDLVLELLEVRKILEAQAVALAAERRDEDDLQAMKSILQAMSQDLKTGDLGDAPDYQFHYALTKATKNKILLRLMNAIGDTMQQTLKTSRIKLYEGEGVPERLYVEHSRIYEAIREQKAEEARNLMMHHLEGVEKQYASEDALYTA